MGSRGLMVRKINRLAARPCQLYAILFCIALVVSVCSYLPLIHALCHFVLLAMPCCDKCTPLFYDN